MADRMRDAVLSLWADQVAAGGRDITISRGATSVSLTAVKGSVLLKLSDPVAGTRMLRTQDDYLVLASDLGELGEPEEGDLIQDAQEGKAYSVLPPGKGEAAWRYTDGTHVLARLHTKEAAS